MKKTMKSMLALLMAVLLLAGLLPTAVFAGEKTVETADKRFGRIQGEHPVSTPLSDAAATREGAAKRNVSLPSRYDSRDYGYVTDVRNQNPYGSCWAHGAMASVESNMIKNAITDASTGAQANQSINLSEYHLAWYNYTYAYDKLGMLTGDRTIPYDPNFLDMGGFGEMASYTLMRWEGPASENTSALAYSNASLSGLGGAYAYQYNVAHVQDTVWIPTRNVDAVKEAIMTYGAGTFGYCHVDAYGNDETGAYCFIQTDEDDYQPANHDVTVVGWDDSYSRYNFNSISRPSKDGAWIIKNSWGTDFGDRGYYYISYEDSASLNDTCYFYVVENVDNYDNIYQYDGTNNFGNYYGLANGSSEASVFTANGKETLEAAAICTWDEGLQYTLSVYRGCQNGNPSTGMLAASQTGEFTYMGYHTVRLDQPVTLEAGERYAVVFELRSAYNDSLYIPVDQTGASEGYISWIHTAHPGTSYIIEPGDDSWFETKGEDGYYNVRIKAYTKDAGEPPIPNETPFTDVDPTAYYYEPVVWAVDDGVTSGTSATTFSPNKPCTRGQVVTFLWRTKGSPAPTTTVNPFFDVQGGSYYYDAVLWAVEHGITSGVDATPFKPDSACTRGQVVTFLWRTAGSPAPSSSSYPFTDVLDGAYYIDPMLWAVEKGITNGVNATSFAPNKTCTRGQIVTFLYRAKDHMTGTLPLITIVDKRGLYQEIQTAEGLNQNRYTAESWAALVTALDAARAVYRNGNATQAQVDNAAAALMNAIADLVERPATSAESLALGAWYSYGVYDANDQNVYEVSSSWSVLNLNSDHSGAITLNGTTYHFTWTYLQIDEDGDYMFQWSISGASNYFYYINEYGELWFVDGTYMYLYSR